MIPNTGGPLRLHYDIVKQRMKTGDVLLFKGDGFISKLIRVRSEFSHAALIVRPREFHCMTDRRWIVEAVWPTIEFRLLSKRLEGEVCWLRLDPRYNEKRATIEQAALDLLGKRYDIPGLFRSAFGHISQSARRLYCSELVAECLNRAGILNEQKAPFPGDLPKLICYRWHAPIRIDY